jgi:hypothetical protein
MRRSRLEHSVLLLFALTIGAKGCIDTQPTPEEKGRDGSDSCPWPDHPGADATAREIAPGSVFYASYGGGTAVLLTGIEGAVDGAGTVFVENQRNQERVRRPAADNGSFAVSIDAAAGDTLYLAFAAKAVITQELSLALEPSSTLVAAESDKLGALAANMPARGLDVVLDAQGLVTVTAVEGSVSAGITLVVANMSGGATKAEATATGAFTVQIPGSSGDSLAIFAVKPSSSQAGGVPTVIRVP